MWPTCNTPNNSMGHRWSALACSQLTLGFERLVVRGWGAAGHMQTPNLRGRLSWGRGGLVFQVQAMPFDRQEFFRKQIEECSELQGL